MINRSILSRIKEERLRLKLTQATAAALAQVNRETWSRYESGKLLPGVEVLVAFATEGADIQYILTGQRQGQGIGKSAVYRAVLDAVDLLSLEKKIDAAQLANAVVKLLSKAVATDQSSSETAGSVRQVFKGPITGEVAGWQVININKGKND